MTLTAVGSEPKYTRIFLDSVLVEYFAFKRELIEQTFEASAFNVPVNLVLTKEKEMGAALHAYNNFLKQHDVALLESEHSRLAGEVSSLLAQLTLLKRQDSNHPKLSQIAKELEVTENQFRENAEQCSKLQELKSISETLKIQCDVWKHQLDRLDTNL